MNSNIQQLALDTTQPAIDKMTPIFIGVSKFKTSIKPTFTDNTYSVIQIDADQASEIEESSIIPYISYWKEVTSEFLYYNTASKNIIPISITTSEKFDNNSIFVVYDIDKNLLFASSIKSFKYNLTSLVSIELDTTLVLTGNLRCKILTKTKEIIPFTYNNFNDKVTLDFTNKTSIVSFPSVVVSESSLSYNSIGKEVSLKTLTTITSDDVTNEQNLELSKALSLCSAATVISIPNESYLNEAIELLKTLSYGYYVVPINLSYTAIQKLVSFIQFQEIETNYLSILLNSYSDLYKTKTLDSGSYIHTSSTSSYTNVGFEVQRLVFEFGGGG